MSKSRRRRDERNEKENWIVVIVCCGEMFLLMIENGMGEKFYVFSFYTQLLMVYIKESQWIYIYVFLSTFVFLQLTWMNSMKLDKIWCKKNLQWMLSEIRFETEGGTELLAMHK